MIHKVRGILDSQEKELMEVMHRWETESKNRGIDWVYNELMERGIIEEDSLDQTSLWHKLTELHPGTCYFIDINSLDDFTKGTSTKLQNIKFNIKNFMDEVPNIIVQSVNFTMDNPVLHICAALIICKTVKKLLSIDINEDQAFVIVALWKNCNQQQEVDLKEGINFVNELYEQYGKPKINEIKYNSIIKSLEKLGSLKIKGQTIELIEKISKKSMKNLR